MSRATISAAPGELAKANARVNDAVSKVDNQAYAHQHEGTVEGHDHHDRIILELNRVQKPGAEARQTHYALENDGPAQEAAQLETCQSEDGRKSVAQCMSHRDIPVVEAFRERRANVILSHY